MSWSSVWFQVFTLLTSQNIASYGLAKKMELKDADIAMIVVGEQRENKGTVKISHSPYYYFRMAEI